jgi:hypothetical protein
MPTPAPSAGAENIPESLREDLAEKLLAGLELSDREDVKSELMKIIEEEASAEDKKEIEAWITGMNTLLGITALRNQMSNKEMPSQYDKQTLDGFFDARDNILERLLELLERKNRMVSTAYAIKPVHESPVPSAETLEKMEETIFAFTDRKNPLHGKKRELPNFGEIETMRREILIAREHIDPHAPEEDQEATKTRLNNMLAGLAVIERIDPIGKFETASVQDMESYVRSQGFPAPEYRPEDPNNPVPRSGIGMGLRAGGLALGAFLAILNSIQAAQKMYKGQSPGMDGILAVAYATLAYNCSGADWFKGKPSEKEIIMEVSKLHIDRSFQATLNNIGRKEAATAAEDLHDLVQSSTQKKVLEKLAAPLYASGVSKEDVEELTGGSGDVFDVLTANGITDQDRRDFLRKMYEQKIEERERLAPILNVIRWGS